MRVRVVVAPLVMVASLLSGCLAFAATEAPVPETLETSSTGPWVDGAPSDATLAALSTAMGTYRFTGRTTFEPTIGTTSSGAVFTDSYSGSGARLLRTTDQGLTWSDVTPLLPTGTKLVPNSNDPFIHVDKYTDRVYDFDMCLLLSGFCMSHSDDNGETWIQHPPVAMPAFDHQSVAAAPNTMTPAPLYPSTLVLCVNRGVTTLGAWCSSSFDGGFGWTPLVPGFPPGMGQCHGLSGHVVGAPDGTFYRGNPSCSGPAVYRSGSGGLSWSQHVIPNNHGTLGGVNSHEVAVAVDDAGNVYAFWIGADGLPYISASTNQAATWRQPIMVGAPGVTATGFPSIDAGADGKVAWTYIGTDVAGGYNGDEADMEWSGYLGFSTDLLTSWGTVAVNEADDPLDAGNDCGRRRCGGFGDFVDVTIDRDGRPWAALAHNLLGNKGIVGTLESGPSLRADGILPPLTQPPVCPPADLTLDTPADGATVSGTVAITGDATFCAAPGTLAVSADGVTIRELSLDGGAYSVDWNTLDFPNGTQTLEVKATDAYGQITTIERAVTVLNDRTPYIVSESFDGVVGCAVAVQNIQTADACGDEGPTPADAAPGLTGFRLVLTWAEDAPLGVDRLHVMLQVGPHIWSASGQAGSGTVELTASGAEPFTTETVTPSLDVRAARSTTTPGVVVQEPYHVEIEWGYWGASV